MMGWAWGKRSGVTIAAVAAAAGAMILPSAASSARAGTIVNDTWIDGTDSDPASPTYSENGVDSDGDGNLESAWFQGGVGSLDPVGANGPLRGNMTPPPNASSASWTTYFTPEAGPVTLGQGESMKVTWQFSLSNVNTSNTSQNFRVALVDSPSATRIAAANGSPGSGAYTGYSMFMNMGQTLGNNSPFQLRERVVSGDLLGTSGNWGANGTANAGLANGATNGATGYTAGPTYTMVWDLTHTLTDELAINVSMTGGTLDTDGVASVSVVDASPNGFTFDTFGIRPSGTTTTAELFDTSLFKVEYNAVPEPASISLLAMGGGSAMLRRRRQRKLM